MNKDTQSNTGNGFTGLQTTIRVDIARVALWNTALQAIEYALAEGNLLTSCFIFQWIKLRKEDAYMINQYRNCMGTRLKPHCCHMYKKLWFKHELTGNEDNFLHELGGHIPNSTNSFCENVHTKNLIDNVKWNYLCTKLWSY